MLEFLMWKVHCFWHQDLLATAWRVHAALLHDALTLHDLGVDQAGVSRVFFCKSWGSFNVLK